MLRSFVGKIENPFCERKEAARGAACELPAAEFELPAAPAAELELPAARAAELELSAAPAAELELPAAELELPAAELELPAAELELPAAELELPAAELEHHSENSEDETASNESEERSELHLAVEQGDVERVKELLASGLDPRITDYAGETPLHTAAYFYKEAVVEILVQADDKKIDIQDGMGRTPLHYAARFGHVGMIRRLLAAGASTRIQDEFIQAPLHFALFFKEEDAAEVLLDADAGIDIQNEDGKTPLHHAATRGCLGAVRRLLVGGVRPNVKDNDGWCPLHEALDEGHEDVVRVIIAWCVWRDIEVHLEDVKLPENQMQLGIRLISECRDEIRKMKDTRVHQSRVSFMEVARRHPCWVAPYLTRETITSVLHGDRVMRDFPNYGDVVIEKLRSVEERRVLMDHCMVCFSLLGRNLPPLPPTFTDMLLLCLSDSDMRNFIAAIKSDP